MQFASLLAQPATSPLGGGHNQSLMYLAPSCQNVYFKIVFFLLMAFSLKHLARFRCLSAVFRLGLFNGEEEGMGLN